MFIIKKVLHPICASWQAALTSACNVSKGSSSGPTTSNADYKRVIRNLWAILNNTFRRFKVKKTVVFAIDGVPPLAKLAISQQRRQRAASTGLLSACIERSFRAKKAEDDSPGTASLLSDQDQKSDQTSGGSHSTEMAQGARRDGSSGGKSGYSIRRW